ncbi:hypothetical protein VOLCADRAFT_88667 [Volvox carteri f. nagariensis]|uniref:PHD-type domain-containing protein n=1 Tax=Volvox carteri f. nagariensis TaxID=3068 RepID=D8TPM3_VOLCA|nr:uncharacterized protein VOLCADRAFT_88667 [Volvox carteri f. nagariensis]EFJ50643.1 hypothetical protein VOLCADRAFT_88667 [Volvox carteri f. nagariensis]|eukprot:XP_002948236.1 hypothetical protein VOLCADRAFT_88667 [Volvox carteri f. nagariensis]
MLLRKKCTGHSFLLAFTGAFSRLLELFNSKGDTYQDARLRRGIRRVLDLQFKGINAGFQLQCTNCNTRETTNNYDPVYLTSLVDTSVSPPVALVRLWHNLDFLCADCRNGLTAHANGTTAAAAVAADAAGAAEAVAAAAALPPTPTASGGVVPMRPRPPTCPPPTRAATAKDRTTTITTTTAAAGGGGGAGVGGGVGTSKAIKSPPRPERAQTRRTTSTPGPAVLASGPGVKGGLTEAGASRDNAAAAAAAAGVSLPEREAAQSRSQTHGADGGGTGPVGAAAGGEVGPDGERAAVAATASGSAGAITAAARDHYHQQQRVADSCSGGVLLQEYFEARSSPVKGKTLYAARVDVTYTRRFLLFCPPPPRHQNYLLTLPSAAASASGDVAAAVRAVEPTTAAATAANDGAGGSAPAVTVPPEAAAAAPAARPSPSHLLNSAKSAAAAAERFSAELPAAEVERLRNLNFAVPGAALQTLSHALLAIADWVLSPQFLEFPDAAAAAAAAAALKGGSAAAAPAAAPGPSSTPGGMAQRRSSSIAGPAAPAPVAGNPSLAVAAQLRPWAFAVRENEDVQSYGNCLRPSLLCLGGRDMGKPPTSLLEVLNTPPLRFSVAMEVLGQKDLSLGAVVGAVARTLSTARGGGFKMRPGFVLPLQRLAALLKRRNKRTQGGPWKLAPGQLHARLGELLEGDVTYNSRNTQLFQQQQQHQGADAAGVGGGGLSGSQHAGPTTTTAAAAHPVDAFLRDLGATRFQVLEALRLDDVDANVGFCVQCGVVGQMVVACDSCVDSYCCSCLGGVDPEDLDDNWRCRYCQAMFSATNANAAGGKARGATAGGAACLFGAGPPGPRGGPSQGQQVPHDAATGQPPHSLVKKELDGAASDPDDDDDGVDDDIGDVVVTGEVLCRVDDTSGTTLSSAEYVEDGEVGEGTGVVEATAAAARRDSANAVAAGDGGKGGSRPDAKRPRDSTGERDQQLPETAAASDAAAAAGAAQIRKAARLSTAAARGLAQQQGESVPGAAKADAEVELEVVHDDDQDKAVEDGGAEAVGQRRVGVKRHRSINPGEGEGDGVVDLADGQGTQRTAQRRKRHDSGKGMAEGDGAGGRLQGAGIARQGLVGAAKGGVGAADVEMVDVGGAEAEAAEAARRRQGSEDDDYRSAASEPSGSPPSPDVAVRAAAAAKGQHQSLTAAGDLFGPSAAAGQPRARAAPAAEAAGSGSDGDGDGELSDVSDAEVAEGTGPRRGRAAGRRLQDGDYEPSSENSEEGGEDDAIDNSSSGDGEEEAEVEEEESPASRQAPQRQSTRTAELAARRAATSTAPAGDASAGGDTEGTDAESTGSDDSSNGSDVEVVGSTGSIPMDDTDAAAALMMLNTNKDAANDGAASKPNAAPAAAATQQQQQQGVTADITAQGTGADAQAAAAPLPPLPQPAATEAATVKPPPPPPRSDERAAETTQPAATAAATAAAAPTPAAAAASAPAPVADGGTSVAHKEIPDAAGISPSPAAEVEAAAQPSPTQPSPQRRAPRSPPPPPAQLQGLQAATAPNGLAAGAAAPPPVANLAQQSAAAAATTASGRGVKAMPTAEVGCSATAAAAAVAATPRRPSGPFAEGQPFSKKEATKAGCRVFEYAAERGVDPSLLAQWTAALAHVLEWYDTDTELQGTLKACLNGLALSATHAVQLANLEDMVRSITKLLQNASREVAAAAAAAAAPSAPDDAAKAATTAGQFTS